MSTLAETFAAAVVRAVALDPDDYRSVIADHDTPYPGGSGEPVSGGGISDPTMNTALRAVLDEDGNLRRSDTQPLDSATARAVHAIGDLAGRCSDATPPASWGGAVHLAAMLDELGMVQAAIDVGVAVKAPVERFEKAVSDVERIRDRCYGHAPTPNQSNATSQSCRSHLRIGTDVPRVTRMLCQWCWRQVQDLEPLGDPVELQLHPDTYWPPEAMLRAHAAGSVADVSRHRRDWLVGLGLNPLAVHNRRQQRRSA